MVRIRLTRTGRKHYPTYRIVITDKREKRDSKSIEEVGYYSPIEKETKLNKDRIEYWLSVGAKPSETVERILVKEKVLKDSGTKKKYSKKPGKKKTERAAAAE